MSVLRVAPLNGETTWSYLRRLAAGYGMDSAALLGWWQQTNHRPRAGTGSPGAALEMLFDPAGQELLARLSGLPHSTLARALPSWQQGPAAFSPDTRAQTGLSGRGPGGLRPAGPAAGRVHWQQAHTLGPVAIACRLCTARRTGRPVHAVRYLPLWQRICTRHHRWQTDATESPDGPGWLDMAPCPEIARAQQRWPTLARRAAARGHDPQQAFALACTIVLGWWQQAAAWPDEQIWPERMHRLTQSPAAGSPDTARSTAVRDAAVLPEVLTVTAALTDPACIRLAHADRSRKRPAGWGAGGRFVHHLGHRLNRPWLGPILSVDYTSPLQTWIHTVASDRAAVRRCSASPPKDDAEYLACLAAPGLAGGVDGGEQDA
ncbi:TniQ family protein [Streptomyces sp. MK7]|uniref:TniQ family protein n=1 Tax=Streptomyces sp. MK7 TaxID=3067635 RepID=UPI00292FE140|nr:TniQ family protein [Streptomyces sp. MK7]